MDSVPLEWLRVGQAGVVFELLGDPDAVHRLHEMGLRIGERVVMVAPGSPCIVRLREHRLCVRADLETSILVTPEAG